MDTNAGYVLFAYIVVSVVLASYGAWLVLRLRRAERSVDPPSRTESRTVDSSP